MMIATLMQLIEMALILFKQILNTAFTDYKFIDLF